MVGELESQIESLKRQARQASRFKNLSADIRKAEATLFHLRWTQAKAQEGEAQSALASATSIVGERASQQMEAAKEQAIGAHRLPDLREAEAAAAAAFQRLSIAKTQIEEEAGRIRGRQSELERRLQQLDADIQREERMVSENAEILQRLADEEAELIAENEDAADREAATRASLEEAAAVLAQSEAGLAKLTAERAEVSAVRNQLERTLRETAERRDRLASQLAEVDRETSEIAEKIAGLADPAEKKILVEQAQEFLDQAEYAANDAEQAVAEARVAEAAARPPLQDAKSELARIETEARTLAKILNAASGDLFPAVLEQISVERGFETALGAALGEDLEAALDRSAPVHWGESDIAPGDPRLPEGVRSLASVVRAPRQLARRLAQIGIVDAADGRRLQLLLAPGQRLVSREGALWRWDGLTASADAPTAAAQRLAQKNRLSELEAEAVAATVNLRAAEAALGARRTGIAGTGRPGARGAAILARCAACARAGARRACQRREGGRPVVEQARGARRGARAHRQ